MQITSGNKYKNIKQESHRVNERIRFTPILLVDQDGQNIGIIPTEEARKKARDAGLDLVEVSPNARPPVCRIMDYGKFRYEQNQKDKKQRQKSKSQIVKEVRLSPRIADHDIETKVKSAKKFLITGHKVQLRLEYKKRENAHKELGFDIIKKVMALLTEDSNVVEEPKLQGRNLTCLLEPLVKG